MKCWIVVKKPAMTMTSTRYIVVARQPSAVVLELLPFTCFNASSGSLTTNTLVSKVCMLLTGGETTHSVLLKVRYQSGHQA